MQQRPYIALVGSLTYIAVVAHPDIARIVHTLQRAQANASQLYWDAAIRLLQYFHTTPTLGPRYVPPGVIDTRITTTRVCRRIISTGLAGLGRR
jgi:hypothetical protein